MAFIHRSQGRRRLHKRGAWLKWAWLEKLYPNPVLSPMLHILRQTAAYTICEVYGDTEAVPPLNRSSSRILLHCSGSPPAVFSSPPPSGTVALISSGRCWGFCCSECATVRRTSCLGCWGECYGCLARPLYPGEEAKKRTYHKIKLQHEEVEPKMLQTLVSISPWPHNADHTAESWLPPKVFTASPTTVTISRKCTHAQTHTHAAPTQPNTNEGTTFPHLPWACRGVGIVF